MENQFSREGLIVSCFGMTPAEALAHISEYRREFDDYILDPDNSDIIIARSEEFSLLKPFICKAQDYIMYHCSPVKPVDDYEKDLLEELCEKIR